MSISSEITRLQGAKADLKSAINAKIGTGTLIDDENIDEYAGFVEDISTGVDINGIIEEYKVAVGENISAGDFVEYFNKQIAEIGEPIQSYTGNSSTQYRNHTAAQFNDEIVIIKYGYYNNSGASGETVCLKLLKITGTTITVSNQAYNIAYSYWGQCEDACILPINDIQFIIVYNYRDSANASASTITRSSVCTIDLTELTITNSDYTQASSNIGVQLPHVFEWKVIKKINNTKFLTSLYAKHANNTYYYVYILIEVNIDLSINILSSITNISGSSISISDTIEYIENSFIFAFTTGQYRVNARGSSTTGSTCIGFIDIDTNTITYMRTSYEYTI